MPLKIKVKKLHPEAKLPSYAHPGDAGMDLYSLADYELKPGERRACATGIALEFSPGYVALVKDKSGLALRSGLHALAGVIDAGYRGEYLILLVNLGQEVCLIKKGEKLAQVLILPVAAAEIEEVSELSDSARGGGGFGSTGR